jgi:signal peptidase I
MDTLDIDTAQEVNKPRNPWISGLISIFAPGLGQIYNGQFNKGIIFYIFPYFLLMIVGFTGISTNFTGFALLFVCITLFRLYCIIDAIWWSRKLKRYYLKPYNSWYYHLIIWAFMCGGTFVLSADSLLGIQTFSIPSSGQAPTIIPEDFVVADLKAYENKEIICGDILLYKNARNEFICRRVVGLEGDKIEIRDGRLVINGELCPTEFTRDKSGIMPVSLYQEILPNGHKHEIQFIQGEYLPPSMSRNVEPIIVPANSYYVIGDFRDNSIDSRTIGCIEKDKIKGQIKFSYWGASFDRIGIDFTTR